MSYATATDFLDRFDAEEIAQRADRTLPRLVAAELLKLAAAGGDVSGYTVAEQDAATAALALINRALNDASAAVDGYLSARYAVPVTPATEVIKRVTCDMARYFLYDDQVTEVIKNRFNDAMKFCLDVSAGKVSLGADLGAAGQPSGGTVEIASGGTVFGRGDTGFI